MALKAPACPLLIEKKLEEARKTHSIASDLNGEELLLIYSSSVRPIRFYGWMLRRKNSDPKIDFSVCLCMGRKFTFMLSMLLLGSSLLAQNNINQIESDVLEYVNSYRESRNLQPFERNSLMDDIAREHSLDMANGIRKFSHSGFKKRAAAIRKLSTVSYDVAENLYMTTYTREVGKKTVAGWISSTGHHKNLIGNFIYAGVGAVKNDNGKIYVTMLYASYE